MSTPKQNTMYVRNPIYVFYAFGAVAFLLLCMVFAVRSTIGPIENALFNAFYYIPDIFTPIFILITFCGSLAAVLLVSLILIVKSKRDIALRVMVSAITAYGITYLVKGWIERGRPDTFLNYVVPKIEATGYGFTSSYAAVAVAVGLTLSLYAPRVYRRWILLAFVVISCSRIVLGVNFPLDIIGGWAVGMFCYSLTSLALGSINFMIDPNKLAKKLQAAGLEGVKLKPASVDARGSVPFFGEYKNGKIFVKVFNQDNNAADWLFKLLRRVQYRRLEDEVPSLTPKRAIEHEAYLTMLAKYNAKVSVPEVLGIYKVGTNSYAMATMRIDATGLDKLESNKITDNMLNLVWEQIVKLHKHNIIHKDLRAANVMIENKTGLPWLIDFGFSECAVDESAYYKDNIEFIASSATKVGAKRAVAAGHKALGRKNIKKAIPYMQYAALSGATTTNLKQSDNLLAEIREEMSKAANMDLRHIIKAKLSRLGRSKNFK
jgi:membrane-associated phospholipid phosphatase/tRNA A-37 threonylcarbamoyl transferase component Bud32